MRLLILFIITMLTTLATINAGTQTVYRVKMLWQPQAQFAGYYVAQADKLYADAGVNVVLEHTMPDENIFDALYAGRADMIVAWLTSALMERKAGHAVVNAGQIAQRAALSIVARRADDLQKPSDINGKRVGIWPSESFHVPVDALLHYHAITNYTVLPIFTSADLFLYGGVDAISSMAYNESYCIHGAGFDRDQLIILTLNDAFPHIPEDGLYCMESRHATDAHAFDAIARATLEGWRRAFKNKPRTLQLVKAECKKANIPFNIAHHRWMLNRMEQIIAPNGLFSDGRLSRAAFDEAMRIIGDTSKAFHYERFAPSTKGDAQ